MTTKTITLKRVPYGKRNTLDEDKEYQLVGEILGPVGTIQEWQERFPDYKIEITRGELE